MYQLKSQLFDSPVILIFFFKV